MVKLKEPELPEDYPIYGGYAYVADGKVVISDWHDITAREFKAREGIKVLCRCDMAGREMLRQGRDWYDGQILDL